MVRKTVRGMTITPVNKSAKAKELINILLIVDIKCLARRIARSTITFPAIVTIVKINKNVPSTMVYGSLSKLELVLLLIFMTKLVLLQRYHCTCDSLLWAICHSPVYSLVYCNTEGVDVLMFHFRHGNSFHSIHSN